MTGHEVYTIGALMRQPFRRLLDRFVGVSYQEDKGFLDSQFVVTGDVSDLLKIKSVVRVWASDQ